jgi:exodeoxyribonuclease VII large subunit
MQQKIYTISQLNANTRLLLEENFPLIWVEGEISNLVQAQSKHIYFSLKDELAQVKCAMFRMQNNALNFIPTNGKHVLAQAQVSLYEQRGDYQLIIKYMEEVNEGVLRRKFEELKNKLAAEGLFAAQYKVEPPQYPKCVGIITSPTGAAIHDIISVLKRRSIITPIIIYPAQVQGAEAASQITAAIKTANDRNECDVLILARGGGSLEDLWSFNEEIVARAIFASKIPIISGVGHEVDFTITDLVADKRAPTPSAAAELVCQDLHTRLNFINTIKEKLINCLQTKIESGKLILDSLAKRLEHPKRRLENYAQNIDNLSHRMHLAMDNCLKHNKSRLNNLSSSLNAMSPLSTLNRGYAIVTKNTKILYDISEVNIGESITARLKSGHLKCTVEDKSL